MNKIIGWLLGLIARIPPRNFEKTLEATLRVLSDWPDYSVDALCLFGRAKGDDRGTLFDFVKRFINNGKARNVLINGSKGERQGGSIAGESWVGGEVFKERLKERCVSESEIHLSEPAFNTADEAEKFLKYALSKNWNSVVLVAWPHQMLRCLGSMVNAMQKSGSYINVYCVCPQKCEWLEEVAGSQGLNVMERKFHINLEYSRIHQYIGKGVATIDEILGYLNQRDKS